MRVSIVATALDGQQPEAKSVINMVHRIHNRNPGYSDFSNLNNTGISNLTNPVNTTVTDGANALKLENEISNETDVISNSEQQNDFSAIASSELINDQDTDTNTSSIDLSGELTSDKTDQSNGLENFDINELEENTPDLFNSEETDKLDEEFTSFNKSEDSSEDDDDLEIPAFLRRQKN